MKINNITCIKYLQKQGKCSLLTVVLLIQFDSIRVSFI